MCYRFKKKKNTSVYVCVQCVFGQLKSLHPTTFCQCVVVIVVIRYRFKSIGRILMVMSVCYVCFQPVEVFTPHHILSVCSGYCCN